MMIDRYDIGEALPVDVRTMGELMEAGAEAPVGVFYCVHGGSCTVLTNAGAGPEHDTFTAETGRAVARLSAAHARRGEHDRAGLDSCFSEVVCELAPTAAYAIDRKLGSLVEDGRHRDLAEAMTAVRSSIQEDSGADLAIFELVGQDGTCDDALLESVALNVSAEIAAAHPDEVMSSDLLSDFIFGEYLSQAGVGVAGDLAAMEQTARNCVSQAATDRELNENLAL